MLKVAFKWLQMGIHCSSMSGLSDRHLVRAVNTQIRLIDEGQRVFVLLCEVNKHSSEISSVYAEIKQT